MFKIFTAFASIALLAAPVIAQDIVPQKTMTIIVDNRAPCFGGQIGAGRELMARMTARNEERRLRKEGYKVKMIYLTPGMERTAPDDSFRTFTSPC
jgi:hypothetical protein